MQARDIGIGDWRYREQMRTLHVLRNGFPTKGEILKVDQNYSVGVDGRHP